jgi:hypothetical protein
MSATLFNRYIWLVNTISRRGKISLEEINRCWELSQYNETHDTIPERTFHRHKEAIKSLFDIDIRCDRSDGNRYYIANEQDLENNYLRKWLLGTFAVDLLTREAKHLKGRILFEDIPSGQHYLEQIIEAMRDSRTLRLQYRTFTDSFSNTEVEPYCVKVYSRRWYMLSRSVSDGKLRVYALDRIVELKTTENSFTLDPNFDADRFFAACYGVIVDSKCLTEVVRIRVDNKQRNYLRTLPLHRSQSEIEVSEDYSVFEYALSPTLDFKQALLSLGNSVEVLSPKTLREQMCKAIEQMHELYK